MLIGNTEVLVPFVTLGGDPTHYDPDYRAKVAYALVEDVDKTDLPHELTRNTAMLKHAKFLRALRSSDQDSYAVYREYPNHGLVFNWASCNNNSQTRYYLDALLLTSQPIDVIAADIGVSADVVRLYEQLYFSCRNEKNYEMILPARVKSALALGPFLELPRGAPAQTQWRLAAAQLGYTALVYRWGWESAAHGDIEAFTSMRRNMWLAALQVEQRLRAGMLSNEELFGVISGCIEYERLLLDRAEKGHVQQQGMELIQEVLQAFAPKLIQSAAEQDGLDAAEQAHYRKLLAEHNISMQDIDDDKLVDVWSPVNQQLTAKFKGVKV